MKPIKLVMAALGVILAIVATPAAAQPWPPPPW